MTQKTKPIVSLLNFDLDNDYFKFFWKILQPSHWCIYGLKVPLEIRGMRPFKLIRFLRFYYRLL